MDPMSVLDYQLVLFDFDGLLVNTEELHFQAYQIMCAKRGVSLPWSFAEYCSIAHYTSDGLQKRIYAAFPPLHQQEPDWSVLYQEKKRAFLDLVAGGSVKMMPGAEALLALLEKANIERCVVTHSSKELVVAIRRQNPILDSIPHWIMREDYTHPKPHPDGYLTAIQRLAKPGDRILGFEDSPRGLTALMQTSAQPVLVATVSYPEIPQFLEKKVKVLRSLEELDR